MVEAVPVYTPTEGQKPLKVFFSFPGGEACKKVQWTFGDGNSSNAITTDHTYTDLGMYYPTCSCELPGTNCSYTFDYLYVIPWSSSIHRSGAGGMPIRSKVERTSAGLSPEELKEQALGLAAIKENTYAVEAFTDVKNVTTLDQATLVSYADVLMALGRLGEAEEAYSQAASDNVTGDILKKYATVLFAEGKTEDAIAAMNRTLALTPEDAGAYASYAGFLKKAGKTEEAISAYNESFRLNSAQPGLWTEYADLLSSIGRLEEAAKAYDTALITGGGNSAVWNKYSAVLQKLGKTEQAQKAKEQATNTHQALAVSSSGDSIISCSIGSLC